MKKIIVFGIVFLFLISAVSAYQVCFDSFFDPVQSCGAPPGAFDPCNNMNCNDHVATSCTECDSNYNCVYDANDNGAIEPGECFYADVTGVNMGYANIDGNSTEHHFGVCIANPSGQGTWQDPDQCANSLGALCVYAPENKPMNWGAATAEEDGIGEYDINGRLTHSNTIQCCGDDFNESYNELNCITKANITQMYIPGIGRPYHYGKCCPSDRPFWNGTDCTLYGCAGGDNLCIDPVLLGGIDPDNNESACMQFQNYTCYNGDTDCCDTIDERGYIDPTDPDSGFGTLYGEPNCCGDDTLEFFATGIDGTSACCEDDTFCSIATFCVPPGQELPTIQGKAYCCYGNSEVAECAPDGNAMYCNDDGTRTGSMCDVGESCLSTGYTAATRVDCDAYDYNDTNLILNSEPFGTCNSGCADTDPVNCCDVTWEHKICDVDYATDQFSNCNSYKPPPETSSQTTDDFNGSTFYCHYNPIDGWYINENEVETAVVENCTDGYDNDCDGGCDNAGCTAPDGTWLERDSTCDPCAGGFLVSICGTDFCCGRDDGVCPEWHKPGICGGIPDPDC